MKTIPGLETRPTPDRLRETLFDVLAQRIPDCVFMDAYAGSGAVGIEALSRGAHRAIFIEKHPAAVAVIRENLAALGVENRAEVRSGKVLPVLERISAGIVFLDPPYEREGEYASALAILGESENELVIVQHSSRLTLKPEYGRLRRYRELKQGDNMLSFYERPLSSP